MNFAKILSLLALTTANCNAFSAVAPSKSASLPSVISGPFEEFQRFTLKKKLIQAAEAKDETLILSLVDEISVLNPTAVPTAGLLGYNDEDGEKAPLNGKWKLLYTNAKDAEAPARTEKNSSEKFGDEVATGVQVKTGQRIDASNGECINSIELSVSSPKVITDEDGEEEGQKPKSPPFDKLEITIKMTPLSDTRVRLDFQKGRALNQNAPLPFLRDFRFNFPSPAIYDFVAKLRGMDPNVEPQAYFDILYIDGEIRAHRTGEGKIFVQKKE